MAVPMTWLAVYLAVGALVLLACSHTQACRLTHRMERNQRIFRMFLFSGKASDVPPPGAAARMPASR